MQVQLIVTNESRRGHAIPVDVPAFRVGQAEDCHLRSKSSQISPHHCVIYTQDNTVTIQDLGGETGTFVNGKRISSPRELKDGDEITLGKHTFALSIKTDAAEPAANQSPSFELAAPPAPEPEPEAEIMFEIRHKGQNVSVTKQRLFEMARKGMVAPDDIITVAGTKIFADTVDGIVFGKEPAPTAAHASTHYPAPIVSAPSEDLPIDTADEPRVQIARVPGARKEVTFSDLGKPLEEPLNKATTWVNDNVTAVQVKFFGGAFLVLCLIGALVYYFMPGAKSAYGAVRISGTLTMDGSPIEGAVITLHPRDEMGGMSAMGRTNRQGKFTVTTSNDDTGLGAIPGDYTVTFSKKGIIPPKYEKKETSGLSLKLVLKGKTHFPFELTSGVNPTQQTEPNGQQAQGFGTGPVQGQRQEVTPPVVPEPPPTVTEPPKESPPEQTSSRFPDIWAAVERGTVQDVEFFLGNGMNINATNDTSDTLLHRAAASNTDVEVLRFLVDNNARVNMGNGAGDTPLHNAARSNPNVEVLRYLSQRANVNAKNNANQTPWYVAGTDTARTAAKRQILIEAGARDETVTQSTGASVPPTATLRTFSDIFEAAARGTADEVQNFLANNRSTDMRVKDDLGRTPLHNAAKFNSDAGVIDVLLGRGAVVDARCNATWTPLHEAARSNSNVEVLRRLVDKGADHHVTDSTSKRTPLHCAAMSNSDVEVVKYLVSLPSVSINLRDRANNTPLHLASQFNSVEVLQYLVGVPRIEINATNTNSETPLDNASTDDKKQILRNTGGKGGKEL